MKKLFRIFVSFILLISMCCGLLCSCKSETKLSIDTFNTPGGLNNSDTFDKLESTTSVTYSFLQDDFSEYISFDENALGEFKKEHLSQPVVYEYEELFDYEKALSGIKSGLIVEEHAHSALDQNGMLTQEHLFEVAKQNTSEYLELSGTSMLKDIDDDLLSDICGILVETTNYILEQHPEIDRNRVYCNLGNLKVVEKSSALDFAAIEPGMVLHVNRHTASMANLLTSGNMYSVLVHETMHIIQWGCECEQIEGCIRRCGLSYAYENIEQDYSDWAWMAEGSAERMTCLYASLEPMTYHNYVNYLLSLDLSIILNEAFPANYFETICFYNDLERLFAPFDATTEEEKNEIYQMIYSLEIMQSEPSDVKEAYKRIYGKEWDAEIRDVINNTLKRSIVQTLIKHFYRNLTVAVANNSLTKNDLLFLINLLESTMNYHVLFNNSKYDDYNLELAEWYRDTQADFFECFDNVTLEDYNNYQSHFEDAESINASLKWLNDAKKDFLAEKFEDTFCDYKFIHPTTE